MHQYIVYTFIFILTQSVCSEIETEEEVAVRCTCTSSDIARLFQEKRNDNSKNVFDSPALSIIFRFSVNITILLTSEYDRRQISHRIGQTSLFIWKIF